MRGGSRLPARRKLLDFWWAVLGSNQWPLPCETEVGCLRINDMRAVSPIATRTCYHVMSFDITLCHARTVPKLSQTRSPKPTAGDRKLSVTRWTRQIRCEARFHR